MNDEMNKMMKRIEDFLNDMEKEALSLGIYEKLEDVFILLGYQHPKQFKSIGEGIRSGWKRNFFASLTSNELHIYF